MVRDDIFVLRHGALPDSDVFAPNDSQNPDDFSSEVSLPSDLVGLAHAGGYFSSTDPRRPIPWEAESRSPPPFPGMVRESEDFDRRESVLHARIAQFETIVRKTKLSMGEKMEKIREKEESLEAERAELGKKSGGLTVREAELTRREELFRGRIEEFAQSEAEFLARVEELLRREEELTSAELEFETRSQRVLREIIAHKSELEGLFSRSTASLGVKAGGKK